MRITFKRLLLFGLVAFVLFAGYFVFQLLLPSRPIAISPQTTVITEPLAKDGLPDYAAYVLNKMKQGVTPATNGAIPYLKAMWPAGLSPLGQPAVCKELGMEVPTQNGMTEPYSDKALIEKLTAWYREQLPNGDEMGEADEAALKGWIRDELLGYYSSEPWAADQAPPLAEWLTAHQGDFDLLAEAAASEHYYLPPETLLTDSDSSFVMVLLPHVQSLRSAVRCEKLRANERIGAGDLASAWQDCQTMYRLADTCQQQYLVGELVSIACAGIADQTTTEILDSDKLTPELAREILRYLNSRPLRNNMGPTADQWERLNYVTSVLEMSGERVPANPNQCIANQQSGPLAGLSFLAIDWNLLLEMGNKDYDELVEAMDKPTATERRAALDAVCAKFAQRAQMTGGKIIGGAIIRKSRTKAIAGILANLMLPAVQAANDAEDRANNLLRLHQVAAALAVYHAAQGAYPESLSALTPDPLSEIPTDAYEQPLVYQPTTDGYLLYSVGPNGKDDGGSHEQWSIYKGCETVDTIAEDRALRERLGEPAEVGEEELDYEFLVAAQGADDVSIRLPLPKQAMPKYQPPGE